MFENDVVELDAAGTLAAAEANEHTLTAAEIRRLHLAAHWADLHAVLDRPGPALPGCERLIRFGGVGTPRWPSSASPSSAPCWAAPTTPLLP